MRNNYDINYFITDHLGSTRVIVDANGTVKGQYNYYPFGKQWEDINLMANTNRYTFSGKEKQTIAGLNYLDFGARMLDAEIGRWFVIDPLAEKYYSVSPYVYCVNNPIKYIDPDGNFPVFPILLLKATGYFLEKFGSNANVRTAGYAVNHPINAARTGTADIPSFGISKIASNFQVNLVNEAGFNAGDGNQGNAYRHALWQSMLTRDLGENQATRIGNAHEDNLPANINQRNFDNIEAADQMVDFLNNSIGREIGTRNKRAPNRGLAEAVLNEYKENGLWQAIPDKGGYKVQKTRLTQAQYDAALKVIRQKGDNGLNK
jgi:RHS repeat-associated protein